ncbi:MAG: hypothetical protein M3332_12340 [Actinomycetota bacterium]|nr:hypothetical protein [Actinomycetota bacterium]
MRRAATDFFEVPGWPPLKNESTSMLAAGHRQAEREIKPPGGGRGGSPALR